MDTDRVEREPVNAPGWKWIPQQGVWSWWDGQRYTTRAEWDGTSSLQADPDRTPT